MSPAGTGIAADAERDEPAVFVSCEVVPWRRSPRSWAASATANAATTPAAILVLRPSMWTFPPLVDPSGWSIVAGVNEREPIATGRDADIFDAGPGRVLRRSRRGNSQEREAKVMEYVIARGYPAPEVYEVSDDGLDMVMQRVDGVTMLDDLGDHPWRLRRYALMLADLHTQLGVIPAPDWLPSRSGPR